VPLLGSDVLLYISRAPAAIHAVGHASVGGYDWSKWEINRILVSTPKVRHSSAVRNINIHGLSLAEF